MSSRLFLRGTASELQLVGARRCGGWLTRDGSLQKIQMLVSMNWQVRPRGKYLDMTYALVNIPEVVSLYNISISHSYVNVGEGITIVTYLPAIIKRRESS